MKTIELIDKYEIRQSKDDEYNPPSYIWIDNTGEIIRCEDCKHYETDHFENLNGIPLIVAHDICMRWGDGCKTSSDGYCFMAERKEE